MYLRGSTLSKVAQSSFSRSLQLGVSTSNRFSLFSTYMAFTGVVLEAKFIYPCYTLWAKFSCFNTDIQCKELWDIPVCPGSPVSHPSVPSTCPSYSRAFERSLDTCAQITVSLGTQAPWVQHKMANSSWKWLASSGGWITFYKCLSFCLNLIYPWVTKLLGFLRQVSELSGMSLDLSASRSSTYLSYQYSCEGKRCYISSLTYGQQKQSCREFVSEEEIDSPPRS